MGKYDWAVIQLYHEQGHSIAECRRVFGFAKRSWELAAKQGYVHYLAPPSPETLTEKYCRKCERTLPISSFSRRGRGWQPNCKECQVPMRHTAYIKNKRYYRARNDAKREELHQWLEQTRADLSCVRCGFSHPAALQFHHRDATPKRLEVALAVKAGWGRQRILAEIEKCDVLCANCHFILHWEQRRALSGVSANDA